MVALLVLPASCNRLSMKKPEEKWRSEEHTSELQSQSNLVCRLLLEKKKKIYFVDDVRPRSPQQLFCSRPFDLQNPMSDIRHQPRTGHLQQPSTTTFY